MSKPNSPSCTKCIGAQTITEFAARWRVVQRMVKGQMKKTSQRSEMVWNVNNGLSKSPPALRKRTSNRVMLKNLKFQSMDSHDSRKRPTSGSRLQGIKAPLAQMAGAPLASVDPHSKSACFPGSKHVSSCVFQECQYMSMFNKSQL